jgi:chaperone required for assembly of F1-ATPase
MSDWAMKRFWTEVSVEAEGADFAIKLDGRTVKTPAKRTLMVPSKTMAQNIANEWDAQQEAVDPKTMPWTRSANAAIDKVALQRTGVMAHLADYAGSDLLCYRAEGPDSLVRRQQQTWDPILDWVSEEFAVRFETTAGVMPVDQPPESVPVLAATMEPMTDIQLTGFYDLVTLSGSFAIALATAFQFQSRTKLWAASRLDEDWQIEQWGHDEEASEAAELKKQAFHHATEVYQVG